MWGLVYSVIWYLLTHLEGLIFCGGIILIFHWTSKFSPTTSERTARLRSTDSFFVEDFCGDLPDVEDIISSDNDSSPDTINPKLEPVNPSVICQIEVLFHRFIVPTNILYVFPKYSDHILTERDKQQIMQDTRNHGNIEGAMTLLQRLRLYEDWFACLTAVLRDPDVKLAHVANLLEHAAGMPEEGDSSSEEDAESHEEVSDCAPIGQAEQPGSYVNVTKLIKERDELLQRIADLEMRAEEDRKKEEEKMLENEWKTILDLHNKERREQEVQTVVVEKGQDIVNVLLLGNDDDCTTTVANGLLGNRAFHRSPPMSVNCGFVSKQGAFAKYDLKVMNLGYMNSSAANSNTARVNIQRRITVALERATEGVTAILLVFNSNKGDVAALAKSIHRDVFGSECIEHFCVILQVNRHSDAETAEESHTTERDMLSHQTLCKTFNDICNNRYLEFSAESFQDIDQGLLQMKVFQVLESMRNETRRYKLDTYQNFCVYGDRKRRGCIVQ